jgi:uncharacterized membrane protein YczE
LFTGLVLFGAGEALLVHSALGNSPWTVLAEGAGEQVGVRIGLTTIAISALILLAWIPLNQRPGFGTIANAIVIGLGIDVVLSLLMTGLAQKTGRSLRSVRVALELSACTLGVLLGGTIGFGTLAFALFIGPAVQFALGRLGAHSAHEL